MIASLRMVLLAGAALLTSVAARAADVTADQGRAAEAAVRAWVNTMLGPAAMISASPMTLTPAGDHFDLTMPLITLPGQPAASSAMMAQARPLDDGKWAVDDIHAAMPMKFTILVPVPADEAKADEKKPDAKALAERKPDTRSPAERKAEERSAQGKPPAARAKTPAELKAEERANQGKPPAAAAAASPTTPATTRVPVTYTVNIVGQDGHAVLDPTLATASTMTTTAKSATIHTEGGPVPMDSTIGAYTSTATVKPSGTDRVDFTADATMQDYHTAAAGGSPMAFTVDLKMVKVAMAVLGLDRSKAQAITQATTSILVAAGAQTTGPASQKIGPELVTAMLAALKDSASEASLVEEVDGMSIDANNVPVTIGKVGFKLDAKSVNGMLEARMPVEVRDIGVKNVLPPDMAALLPTLVTLRPAVSGVGVAELSRIATAYNEKKEPSPADMQALFSHGGIKLGLEAMSVALAGATFEGEGAVIYTSAVDFSGTMRITATGYDDMIQKVSTIPALKGQAVPALVFVKGIGKAENNKIVWDIVYKDGKALVNNVDMSSMMGAAGK